MSEDKSFKLTAQSRDSGYTLTKLVHEEWNLYAEMREDQRSMELWVRGEALDDAHSVTFEVPWDTDEMFEIIGDHILMFEEDNRHIFVDGFNRRGGNTPTHSQEGLSKIADEMEESYVSALEEEGWEQVGY